MEAIVTAAGTGRASRWATSRKSCFWGPARLGAAAALLLGSAAAGAGQCYVNHAAGGANDGSSWANAYTDLQSALQSGSPAPACTEIWVAQGVYKPAAAGSPDVAFSIRPGQQVYGGFAGTETQRGQADPAAHRTVLSGDIDGDDTGKNADGVVLDANSIAGSNSSHVVLMDGTTGTGPIGNDTVLDGLAITGGVGRQVPYYGDLHAGGLYCNGRGSGSACSPVLSRLWFSGNRAEWGGAMFVDGGTDGGSNGGSASPVITRSLFSGNRATHGGGAIYLQGSGAMLAQLTLQGNTASWSSAVQFQNSSGATLRQSTISGNTATDASVKSAVLFSSASSSTLDQVILWGNDGRNLYIYSGTPTVANSIVQGGCAAPFTCTNVSQADPQLGPLQDNGGATMSMLPAAGSPAIDFAGNTGPCGAAASYTDADQRGVARPQGTLCDIGAVEYRTTLLQTTVAGAGSVSAAATPAPLSGGISQCQSSGTACQASYSGEGTPQQTTLTASPDTGSAFTGWSGACSGSTLTCIVTLDAAKSVQASFAPFSIPATNLPAGTYGTAYSQPLAPTPSGGTGPYSYSVSGLPPGFSYAAGVLSAPATQAAGSYQFKLTATDANGATTEPANVAVVIKPAATSTSLSASATMLQPGQSVTFSAQVNLPAGAGGTVDFVNGTQVLCASVPVAGGQASCSVPRLPPGTATVQARFAPGDGNTTGSDSNGVAVVVAAAPAVPVPALSPWALALLAGLLAPMAKRRRR